MDVLAIDLGGTHVKCAIVRDGSILACREIAPSSQLEPLLPVLASTLAALLKEVYLSPGSCAGLVIGFCGLVDACANRVTSTNGKYDDAPNLDLAEWARETFQMPFRIENDVRLALLGEVNAGAARNATEVLMVTIGTGIGGAAMMNGQLVRGKHHQAGCLGGHLLANWNGRRCTCGALGCAEAEASTWALPAIAREWPGFAASALANEDLLDFAALFRAADSGDRVANEILSRSIRIWSAATVSLIHAYDPELIVFGGGVMNRAEAILPQIQAYVDQHAWTPWGKVTIVRGALGSDAALYGAIPLLKESQV